MSDIQISPCHFLTTQQCATHWACTQRTVWNRIKAGVVQSERLGRDHFIPWPEVWKHERGTLPRPHSAARYKTPLLDKPMLASETNRSVSTVRRLGELPAMRRQADAAPVAVAPDPALMPSLGS